MPQDENLSAGLEPIPKGQQQAAPPTGADLDLSAGLEPMPSDAKMRAEQEVTIFRSPLGVPLKVPASTFRAATATLPWITGAAGGILGSGWGSIPLAGLFGGAGEALRQIVNRVQGVGQTPETSGQAAGQIGVATGEQAGLEAGGMAANWALKPLAKPIERSAARSLEQVLGATTQKLKAAATEKVVPGMIERDVGATSRAALLERATANVQKFGQQVLEAAQAADATGRKIPTQDLIGKLEMLKEDYMVRDEAGGILSYDRRALATISGIQTSLKLQGDEMLPTTAINFRRFLDDQVARTQKGFLLGTQTSVDEARKWAANGIRDVINKAHPSLADVNKEYAFWKDLETVMSATQQRTASQSGLMRHTLRAVRGGGVGGAVGHAVGGPVGATIGGIAGMALEELFGSTAWQTATAPMKLGLAKAIASGDAARIVTIAGRIGGAAISARSAAASPGDPSQSQDQSQADQTAPQ